MVKIIYIFLTIIINRSLFILFIFNKLKNFAIEVENYRLNYLQDNLGNENLTLINQALFWQNNLVQLVDNFVLSNKKRNFVNKFETNSAYEFNLSFWELSTW